MSNVFTLNWRRPQEGFRLALFFLMSCRTNLLFVNFLAENCMDLPLETNNSFAFTDGTLYLRSSKVWCPGMMALHWWHAVFEVDWGMVSRYNRTVPLLVPDPLVYELWESLCDQLLLQRCDLYCLFTTLGMFHQNIPKNAIIQKFKTS